MFSELNCQRDCVISIAMVSNSSSLFLCSGGSKTGNSPWHFVWLHGGIKGQLRAT